MQLTQEIGFDLWVRKIPWKRKWQLPPVQYSYLEIPWTEEPDRLYSPWSHRVRHNWACTSSVILILLCQGSLFVSLVVSFSCVPVVKCMAPVDGTLLSCGYLLGRFSLPITFSRIQKFDSTSSVNTGNFKKDVPDNHVHISLAFQLLDIDLIFRFHISSLQLFDLRQF